MEKKNEESSNYVLSKKWLYIIMIYYSIILITGMIATVYVMVYSHGFTADNILFYTNVASLSVAGMLCSVQYLKRLYKACLDERIIFLQEDDEIKQLGHLLFFILRPIYAMAFAIVAKFALLAGVVIVTSVDHVTINERFLYLSIVMSSIIGFSIGSVLDGFDALSSRHINNILQNRSEK